MATDVRRRTTALLPFAKCQGNILSGDRNELQMAGPGNFVSGDLFPETIDLAAFDDGEAVGRADFSKNPVDVVLHRLLR